MSEYILSFDSGTTSVRTLLIDKKGQILSIKQMEIDLFMPKTGWVEQSAEQIWKYQLQTFQEIVEENKLSPSSIAAIGIANQRETIIAWNKETGEPIYNAIIWQDLRTEDYCQKLINEGFADFFKKKTGLIINPYFSATKIKWILDNVEEAKKLLSKNSLLIGTVDTWLIWKATNKKEFSTDISNASRTLLFNIHEQKWDEEILKFFDIPINILPKVKDNSDVYGNFVHEISKNKYEIPISGVIGDQQSALFASFCHEKGTIKNTYGTGCFCLINTGTIPIDSKHQLLTTIAWKFKNQPTVFALEGSVFSAASTLQWLKDSLNLIKDVKKIDEIATSCKENNDLFFVPAFTGLGAPYWDSHARAAILGIEKNTTKEQIIKSAVDSIALQTHDLITSIEQDLNQKIDSLRVDGGLSQSNYLLQKQSDISQIKIVKSKHTEMTGLGAAYFAGLTVGFWKNIEEVKQFDEIFEIYKPIMQEIDSSKYVKKWHHAVGKTLNWKSI